MNETDVVWETKIRVVSDYFVVSTNSPGCQILQAQYVDPPNCIERLLGISHESKLKRAIKKQDKITAEQNKKLEMNKKNVALLEDLKKGVSDEVY